MKIKVIVDSGSCLSQQQAQRAGLEFLPLQVMIEDKTYMDGIDLMTESLYDNLDNGFMPQTSLPPLAMIKDLFDRLEKEQVSDVILITLSSGLSSTNATIQAISKEYQINVHTFDIYSTLAVEQYLALSAIRLVKQGVEIDEIMNRLKESMEHSKGYLMPENLNHLAKGGRLSSGAAKLAGMLKIVPILEVSKDTQGKVGKDGEKVRTMTKAIGKVCKSMIQDIKDGEYEVYVLDSRSEKYAQMAEDLFKDEGIEVHRMSIGAVIASHTGNGAIGIQYIKKVKGH